MSRFSHAFIIGSALAMFAAAPLAMAQTAPAHTPQITAAQSQAGSTKASMHETACFSEDLVPQDNSSMLTICGTGAAPKIIFAE